MEAPRRSAHGDAQPFLPPRVAATASALHSAIAMKPAEGTRGGASAPDAERDDALIVAIEIELTRLGLYDDILTPAWSENVRKAVWRFTGLKDSAPSPRLLAALRTAKPEVPRGAAPQQASIGKSQQKLAAAAPESVASEGYLPPWEELRAKEAQAMQADVLTPPENPRARAHNRQRAAAARLASARRFSAKRRLFANANFSWPDL